MCWVVKSDAVYLLILPGNKGIKIVYLKIWVVGTKNKTKQFFKVSPDFFHRDKE